MATEDYLSAPETAILIMNKCRPSHRQTVFVREQAGQLETIWEGEVEVFDLAGHKKARRCYAWQHVDAGGNARIFAVLDNKLVNSAGAAVQAAIFARTQPPPASNDLELRRSHYEKCRSLIRKMGVSSEDLEASIEAARGTMENIKQRRSAGTRGHQDAERLKAAC
jgi:hypothetical protein